MAISGWSGGANGSARCLSRKSLGCVAEEGMMPLPEETVVGAVRSAARRMRFAQPPKNFSSRENAAQTINPARAYPQVERRPEEEQLTSRRGGAAHSRAGPAHS